MLALAFSTTARGNPDGGSVAAGQATIQVAPSSVTVDQQSDRAVINWQGFSIGESESVQFNQPSHSSITLNRVTGSQRSDIFGNLRANGQVWLINPNGIIFGRNARVDVGGLLATTHDIKDADFMGGKFDFRGNPASTAVIQNYGNISVRDAGLAAFVAPGVANHGVISARLGNVTLASGNRFTVDFYGDQRINLALDEHTLVAPKDRDGNTLESPGQQHRRDLCRRRHRADQRRRRSRRGGQRHQPRRHHPGA